MAAGRVALLTGGCEGWLGEAFGQVPTGVGTVPLFALAAYLAKHTTRLGYAERLASGRSIGSGAVEGDRAADELATDADADAVEHVGPLVELRALSRTPAWNELWNVV